MEEPREINNEQFDTVFLHARRETLVLLFGFAFFLVWTIGVSWRLGYNIPEAELRQTVMGVPRWVFWGVGVPWMASNVFTIWFAWFYMADDPLGEELESNPDSPDQSDQREDER